MSAFVIAHISVKEPNKWNEYASQAPSTIKKHDGEIIFKGKTADILSGEHPFDVCVIIRFPDYDAIDRWYYSTEYQSLIPVRDAGADVRFIAYSDT